MPRTPVFNQLCEIAQETNVSHRLLASFLGISAATFERWTKSGAPSEYQTEIENLLTSLTAMKNKGLLPSSLYSLAARGLITLSQELDSDDFPQNSSDTDS